MSRYVTYKLWSDRTAPNNLEFNGRLIGEKVISTTPITQMSCTYDNDDEATQEYMYLIERSPEDTVACHCHSCNDVFRYDRGIVPSYCSNCGAKVVHDHGND